MKVHAFSKLYFIKNKKQKKKQKPKQKKVYCKNKIKCLLSLKPIKYFLFCYNKYVFLPYFLNTKLPEQSSESKYRTIFLVFAY